MPKKGLFKNLVYRSVDLATKKIWAMFPMGPLNLKKIVSKNPSNYYLLKVGKFHGDSVKNKSARTKKLQGVERPPPACLGLKSDHLKLRLLQSLLD